MKKQSCVTKGGVPGSSHERQDEDEHLSKKSEFSKKMPLPSIAAEQDPEFPDSVLCAATMHIRRRAREPGPTTARLQCAEQIPTPRARNILRPGPGRRSPPVPPGPAQGPCGDLPHRTTDGTHKRDLHGQCEGQQRQSLLNPPWRATCAVIEPTNADNICLERLPRGLKPLSRVDLCYRHGHRRVLDPLGKSQNAEVTQKRGYTVQQRNGPKQRGDLESSKKAALGNIFEPILNVTVADDNHPDPNWEAITDEDVGHGESLLHAGLKSTTDDSHETSSSAPTQRQPEIPSVVINENEGDSAQTISTLRRDDHQQCNTDCKTDRQDEQHEILLSSIGKSQGIARQTEEAETSFKETDSSDMEVGTSIPSKRAMVKADSVMLCRTVGRLHTDERPQSFAALSAKERGEAGHAVLDVQPASVDQSEEKDQPYQNMLCHSPLDDSADANHAESDSACSDTNDQQWDTSFDDATTIGVDSSESSAFEPDILVLNASDLLDEDPGVSAAKSTPTKQPQAIPNLTKPKVQESLDSKTTEAEYLSRDSNVYRLSVNDEFESKDASTEFTEPNDVAESQPEQSQNTTQTSPAQSDELESVSSFKRNLEDVLEDNCETEHFSFAVDAPQAADRDNEERADLENAPSKATTNRDTTQTHKSPSAQSGRRETKKADSKDVRTETLYHKENIKPRSDQEDTLSPKTPKSKLKVDQSPDWQRSLSYPDLAIDVRFFKTPENDKKSPLSNSAIEVCFRDAKSPLSQNDGENSDDACDGQSNILRDNCTIVKIPPHDEVGKFKYLVLPDRDKFISGSNARATGETKMDRQEVISPNSRKEEDKFISDAQTQKILSEFPIKDINSSTGEKMSDSKVRALGSQVKAGCTASQRNTQGRLSDVRKKSAKEGDKNEHEKGDTDDTVKTGDSQIVPILKKTGTGTGGTPRNQVDDGVLSTREDEIRDAQAEFGDTEVGTKDSGDVPRMKIKECRHDEDKGERDEDDVYDDEWCPPHITPLPDSVTGVASGPPPEQVHPRRIKFDTCQSNRFFRIHGNLHGDGPWGQGDSMERPGNYVEPTVTLDDLCTRFFTDTTPLDVAFNSINVINSCSNSISYHSCHNQKRVLAALDNLKEDDVYKHALLCPLARQCAMATREFSQSLHRVFRRFSNRARAAQEALIEYYRALAAGEVTSPEMLKQIKRDGRKLYMVWEGGQYVTRYADDAADYCSSSSGGSGDTNVDSTAVEITDPDITSSQQK